MTDTEAEPLTLASLEMPPGVPGGISTDNDLSPSHPIAAATSAASFPSAPFA